MTTAMHFHHAAQRHHRSAWDAPAAITSHVLEPVRGFVDWLAGRPELLILPALAVLLLWAGYPAATVIFGAPGAVLMAAMGIWDAATGTGYRSTKDRRST